MPVYSAYRHSMSKTIKLISFIRESKVKRFFKRFHKSFSKHLLYKQAKHCLICREIREDKLAQIPFTDLKCNSDNLCVAIDIKFDCNVLLVL